MRAYGLLLALLFAASPVASQSEADWNSLLDSFRHSTRADNPSLLVTILDADESDAIALLGALAERDDPDVGAILTGLLASTGTATRYVREYELRRLISDELWPGRAPEGSPDPSRIAANRESLEEAFDGLDSLRDAQLRRVLLLLSPALSLPAAAPVLGREGQRLVALFSADTGTVTPDVLEEARAFVVAAQATGDPVLRDQIGLMIERSRDALFVREARAAVADWTSGGS